MSDSRGRIAYCIISPVKDEERYVEGTLRSVVSQSIRPRRWIIVDDCSTDKTSTIVRRFCEDFPWIMLVRTKRHSERKPGTAIIDAFNYGYQFIRHQAFQFIVKLDCDITFDSDYFEKLFLYFQRDERLGIASGIYLEGDADSWTQVQMPEYHAAGASKVVKAECFQQIRGFVAKPGWDTVDEIKAQTKGWRTGHFKDLIFYHHKKEGSSIGGIRTNLMHGEIYYTTGGSFRFFLFKLLHRLLLGKPFILGGVSLLIGNLAARIKRQPLLVSSEEARFYQRLLNNRIQEKIAGVMRHLSYCTKVTD